jgi:predicted nucleic acid-binding protein
VIIKAKETRIIKKVKPLIEKLEKADFRISPKLKNHILAKAEE